ncbi:MAG: ABC transporter substrate-binding protein [Firmicutes bacterium]|nr:ABC transporter substrate-binding protein [Bacillota bacterium]
MKKLILAAVVVAAVMVFALFAGSACSQRKAGGVLRIGTVGRIDQVNPLAAKDDISAIVRDAVFASLFRYNEKWEEEPYLLERMPDASDGSVKHAGSGMISIDYTLKPDYKWSNGNPIDAYDLLFAYQMEYSPRFSKFNPDINNCVKKASVSNPQTASFTIVPGVCDFPPVPLSKKALEGKLIAGTAEELSKEFAGASPYSGPYIIKSFEPRKIVLARNSQFTKYFPAIDTIEIICYASETEMLEQYKKKMLDVITPVSMGGLNQIPDDKGIKKLVKPGSVQICLIPNLDNTFPSDIRFRKAVMYALKRNELSKKIMGSQEFMSISWLSPRHPASVDVLSQYSASEDKAQQMFEEMGYKQNKDGHFEKDGILLTPSVIVNSEEPLDYAAALYLKESLERVGAGLDIKAYPPDECARYLRERIFPDFIIAHIATPPSVDPEKLFHSKQIPGTLNDYNGLNYSGWRNSDNDALCVRNKDMISRDQKITLLKDHQKLFAADLPYIPLLIYPEIVVHDLSITNIKPRGFGAITWNIEEWIR